VASNATPIARVVSASKARPSRYGLIGMLRPFHVPAATHNDVTPSPNAAAPDAAAQLGAVRTCACGRTEGAALRDLSKACRSRVVGLVPDSIGPLLPVCSRADVALTWDPRSVLVHLAITASYCASQKRLSQSHKEPAWPHARFSTARGPGAQGQP